MKNRIISTAVLTFAAATMMIMGCKKNSTTTDPLVGDWKLSNIQGAIDTVKAYGHGTFMTSYDNAGKMKIQTFNGVQQTPYPYTLEFNMKADMSVLVRETRTQDGMHYDTTYKGTWMKNTASNTVTINGFENTDFYGDFGSKTFVIKSVANNTLMLTYNNSTMTASPAWTVNIAYTLTFSK